MKLSACVTPNEKRNAHMNIHISEIELQCDKHVKHTMQMQKCFVEIHIVHRTYTNDYTMTTIVIFQMFGSL